MSSILHKSDAGGVKLRLNDAAALRRAYVALASALAQLAVLAATLADCVAEIDINPLIAGPDGCIAVDGLVVPNSL